jgi:hypothetical protein
MMLLEETMGPPAPSQIVPRKSTRSWRRQTFLDALCAAALFLAAIWIFAADSHLLGVYADDSSFFLDFPNLSIATLTAAVKSYVTGRNLHMVWQYVIFAVTGNTIDALPRQHQIQAFVAAVNCVAVYGLFRWVGLPLLAAFLGGALFALVPNRAEVYFWLTAIPQNLVSTFLLLLLSAAAIKTILIARFASSGVVAAWLGVDLIIFVAAIFTYDQVVIIAVVILLATAGYCLASRADLRMLGASCAATGLAVFILWTVWKILVPSSGPSLANVSPLLLVRNVIFSVSLAGGPHLFRSIEPFLPVLFASSVDRYRAIVVALSFLVVGLICLFAADRHSDSTRGGNLIALVVARNPAILLLGSVLFFVLAYAPAYLWFISSRHTYLPGIAVAAGAAWCIWQIPEWVEKRFGSRAGRGSMLAALVAVCWVTYVCAGLVLAEKRDWILSYQARRQMYAELARDPRSRTSSTLILEGFPDSIRRFSAPFGYQSPAEPTVLTRGLAHYAHVVQTSEPARSGAFINVDPARDGDDAFLYVPESVIYRVRFDGLANDRVLYSSGDAHLARSGYHVRKVSDDAGLPQSGFFARHIAGTQNAIELRVPAVSLEADQVLAVSALQQGRGLQRMAFVTEIGAKCLVLVDLSGDEDGTSRRLMITYDDTVDPIVRLQVYAVGEHGRRLVADLDVKPAK